MATKRKEYFKKRDATKDCLYICIYQTNLFAFAASGELPTSDNSLFVVDDTGVEESTEQKDKE